jgi:DNA-directed RNA polymerase specialized sigma24 family protein
MSSAPLEAVVSRDAGGCFEEFVRGRLAHLFELALLLTAQNQAEAGDLLQIALERAYRRRASLFRDRDPEPYVRRALVNASIDRWRVLRRHADQRLQAADCGPGYVLRLGQVVVGWLVAGSRGHRLAAWRGRP